MLREATGEDKQPLREPTALEYQLTTNMLQGNSDRLESENKKLRGQIDSMEKDARRKADELAAILDRYEKLQEKTLTLQKRLIAVREAVLPE